MEPFVIALGLIGLVVIVASLLSGVLERHAVPIVVVFLAIGALLGPVLGVLDVGFDSPELRILATLALALVLFTDAVTLDLHQVRARRGLALTVVGPGTLVPAVLLTLAAAFLLELAWPAAAMLGAAMASTDPVLLRGALRSRDVPENARTALRMETGMNDVVLLPIIVLAVVWAGGGGAHGGIEESPNVWQHVLGLFLLGPALGLIVGWAGISALGWVRSRIGVRRDYESLYALGLAFCAFAAAEAVGGSGFVAAFAAGFVIDARDTELCDCFMEYGEATAEMFLLLAFVALGAGLLWTGLDVINERTLVFAGIALTIRTLVLYPMLGGLRLGDRDRWLIALMGPRGLSSLLLALLPVFAGVSGARELFAVVCLVVLISMVIHGAGIAWLVRSKTAIAPGAPEAEAGEAPVRIGLEEFQQLRSRGGRVAVGDARKDAAWYGEGIKAAGAFRLDPDAPVRDAETFRLPRDATIAVYCA